MQELEKLESQMLKMTIDHWFQYDLFSWRWWLLSGGIVLSLVIFLKLLDQSRKKEILLFGFLVALIVTFLDLLGWNLHLWTYPFKLLPMCTPLLPVDYVTIPIFYMLIYQWFRSWRPFFWASTVLAILMAYVLEPLSIWLEFYKPIAWKHIYSFPIYILIAVVGKWATGKIKP